MSGDAGKPKAVGYTRVSTEDQQTRLDDDRARITAACTAYGYTLVEVIEDREVSGAVPLAERPNGRRVQELIEAKRPAAGILIVTNLDRLTRDSAEGIALIKRMVPNGRRSPILLVSLDDHIDLAGALGRFFARLRVLLGEYERELIGERTGNALAHKRRIGQAFSREPYGWDQTEDGRLVRNDAEQAVIAEMRAWHSDGVTDNAIATRLNDRGVPGKRGGRWQANTVWRILRSADGIGTEASS
jgi:site-specific DNA recombinase